MARSSSKDILQNPVKTAGATRKTVDAVVAMCKVGNGLVSLMSGLLASVLILYSSYVLYDSFATEYRAKSSAWDLLRYKPSVMEAGSPNEGADQLAAINKDYRAWLTLYDTTIDYPVVQGEDDLYYASHDVYGNVALTGSIYLAAGNSKDLSDSYNLIYGHHMDNGAMFGALDKYMDSGYFKQHQSGIVIVGNKAYDVTLFAAVTTDAYEQRVYSVGNRAADVMDFLTGDRSGDTGVGTVVKVFDQEAAKGATKILALSTCADAQTNGRLVIFGKMEPHEIDPVTLTVHYYKGTGTEKIRPTVQAVHQPGDQYYVVSPKIPGYEVDIEIVRGTIREDMVIIVRYKPVPQKLTIRYVFLDGTKAAETYSGTVLTGEQYSIESPNIPGYVALKIRIAGTNPGRDEQYTVLYVPEGMTVVPDPDTPTGLDTTYLQIGICYE